MLKRNDRCHCGSGKKYKKCCLENDKKNSFELEQIVKLKKCYLNTCTNVMTYASQRDDFREIINEASNLFFPMKMECPKELLPVFNTFIIKDLLLKDNKSNLILDYYNEFREKLTPIEVNVLYNIAISYTSLYVVDAINGYKIRLKDLFTDEIIEVKDDILVTELSVNAIYIANVVNISNVKILTDILFEVRAKNVFENIVCDVVDIYNNHKEQYESKEDFLRRNCLLFYYHMIQIIVPETTEAFESMINESLENRENNQENIVVNNNVKEEVEIVQNSNEEECKVNKDNLEISEEIVELIDSSLRDKVLDILNISLDKNSISKVSEAGWVSAMEYHLKKEAGENITQAQIAQKYNISSSTLGKRYKIVKEFSN